MTKLIHEKPYLLALLVAVALGLWLLSGSLEKETAQDIEREANNTPQKFDRARIADKQKVRAKWHIAEPYSRVLSLYGQSKPARSVTVKSQVTGRVSAILVNHGLKVDRDQSVILIEKDQRPLAVEQAQAELKQRELEFQGTQSLQTKGFNAQSKLAEAKANLEAAKTRLKTAELELSRTKIRVPFGGILNERFVEEGDYVVPGQALFEIIEVDPLVIKANAPESEIAKLKLGMKGSAKIGKEAFEGTVNYVSRKADEKTRTFVVELAIANPGNRLSAGVSATLDLIIEQIEGHQIPSSLLSLNAKGDIGLKTVSDDKIVFKEVDVIASQAGGVWVSGLAGKELIVTMGQGFVQSGDHVEVTVEEDAANE